MTSAHVYTKKLDQQHYGWKLNHKIKINYKIHRHTHETNRQKYGRGFAAYTISLNAFSWKQWCKCSESISFDGLHKPREFDEWMNSVVQNKTCRKLVKMIYSITTIWCSNAISIDSSNHFMIIIPVSFTTVSWDLKQNCNRRLTVKPIPLRTAYTPTIKDDW